jgi:hypothetical protein
MNTFAAITRRAFKKKVARDPFFLRIERLLAQESAQERPYRKHTDCSDECCGTLRMMASESKHQEEH